MSSIIWAKTVRCDYPDCPHTAEATMPENSLSQKLPLGWLDLGAAMIQMQAPFGVFLREFCPDHASYSIKQLVNALVVKGKTDG